MLLVWLGVLGRGGITFFSFERGKHTSALSAEQLFSVGRALGMWFCEMENMQIHGDRGDGFSPVQTKFCEVAYEIDDV